MNHFTFETEPYNHIRITMVPGIDKYVEYIFYNNTSYAEALGLKKAADARYFGRSEIEVNAIEGAEALVSFLNKDYLRYIEVAGVIIPNESEFEYDKKAFAWFTKDLPHVHNTLLMDVLVKHKLLHDKTYSQIEVILKDINDSLNSGNQKK